MAGFLALSRARAVRVVLASLLAIPVHAAATNAAPAAPAPGTPAAMAGKPVIPPVPQDDFQKYGKIIAPGTEPAHPLKLEMPLPDVGQIKIPSQGELDMRAKLEHLITMSDDEIRQDLAKWPAFDKMSLADEGAMLMRIQQFKDRRAKIAQERAHALGLLTLKPDQLARFEQEYWDKRLQIDRDMAKQFEPIFQARETQVEEQLYREFSTPGKPVPPPPPAKPPATATPPAMAQPMH